MGERVWCTEAKLTLFKGLCESNFYFMSHFTKAINKMTRFVS